MKEELTVVTRKGQITVPAGVGRALKLRVGDKVAISLADGDVPGAHLRPVHSVAEMTFGALTSASAPDEISNLRELAMEEMAENAASEGRQSQP